MITASPGETASIDNCLIVDNNISGNVSKMFTAFTDGSVEVINCTIVGNDINNFLSGSEGNFFLVNTIVYFNTLNPVDLDPEGRIFAHHCIIEDFTNALEGIAVLDIDPLFVNAPIGNYRLKEQSPAINIGDNNVNVSSLNLSYNIRLNQGTIDISAYESDYSSGDIYACLDPNACNYNPAADFSNGSCFYPGCYDEDAANYNPFAFCGDQ